jgi:PKD repeat protein
MANLERAFVLSLLISFAEQVHAQSVSFAWDADAATNLAGYRVYRSQQSGVFSGTPLNGTNLITTTVFTDATVQYGQTYYYVLAAVDTSGQQSANSNQLQALVPAPVTNKAPVVNAGADQVITLPATASLSAAAIDDGLPTGSSMTYQWSVINGAGVTFTPSNATSSKASFVAAGIYTIRLTVSDGPLSAHDDMIVQVKASPANTAPLVSAGPSQTITLPGKAPVAAAATDDGLPNNKLTYSWSVVNRSDVSFTNAASATTSASFSTPGSYTIRVTVSDGQLSTTRDVAITVLEGPAINLLTSKSGTLLRGTITSVNALTADPRVTRLELYINDRIVKTVEGTSLTYRWNLRNVSGNQTVASYAYGADNALLLSKSVIVSVQ